MKTPAQVPFWKVIIAMNKRGYNPCNIITETLRQTDGIYQTYLGFKKIYMTDRPEIAQHVLQKNHRNYKKSFVYDALREEIGNGLLTSEGDYWLRQRRLIQPGFHKEKLEALVEIMVTEIETFSALWHEKTKRNEPIDITREMLSLTLEIIMRSMFSRGIKSEEVKEVEQIISEMQAFIVNKVRKPYFVPFKYLSGAVYRQRKKAARLNDLLTQIIRQRKESSETYDDLLDMLLKARYKESNEGMTEQQLLEEILILFLAGHETSSNALTWLWYLVSIHPEVMKKLVEEADQVLGERRVTFEDLPQLTYTKKVIQEAMRLYPPAWIIDREAIEADEIDGVEIPKGAMVNMLIFSIHRNPKYWKNPETFNPERFSEENMKNKPTYAYMPFGGGPRLCIGNNFAYFQMVAAIGHLVRSFEVELLPNQKIDYNPLITLRPRFPILMRLKAREKITS